MNIIVRNCDGSVECRPDTTWERENKDFYSPDFVTGLSYAPVFFARVCKAGKCVLPKFATRYYNAVSYGLLLYPETADGRMSIMDRTSFLPSPMYNRPVLESGENLYELRLDGEAVFSTALGSEAMVEAAIAEATKFMSVRIGDIVAVALAPVAPLPRSAPGTRLSATFCGNWLFDFLIK